jgi:chlorophyllide a reductase subunit Y
MIKTIPIIASTDKVPEGMSTSIDGDGMGCHAGGEKMLAAAKASGKSAVLAQYAKD